MSGTIPTQSIRGRARNALRTEIADVALQLFLERGYEATTADQIAVAAGVSRSTFFRYFATKEEVILSQFEEKGHQLASQVQGRPSDEPAWQALRHGFLDVVRHNAAQIESDGTAIRMARLQVYTGALRAAGLNQRARWRALLAPDIAHRLGTSVDDDPRPMALAAAAIGCLESAVVLWGRSGGRADLVELVDTAMGALDPAS